MNFKIIISLLLLMLLCCSLIHAQTDTYYYYKVLWTGRFDVVTIPPTSGGLEAIWWAGLTPTINISSIETAEFPVECDWSGWYKIAIENALYQWDAVLNSPINFNYLHGATQSDNYLEIYFSGGADFPPDDAGVGGRAYVAVTENTEIKYHWDNTMTKHGSEPMTDTQVKLNNSQSFQNFGYRWTDWITDPDSYTWHVETVVKHELGHTFGLTHNLKQSIMNVSKIYPGENSGVYDVQDYDGSALFYLDLYWESYYIGIEDRVIITSGPTVIEQNQLINEYTAVFDEHHEPGEEPDYIIEWNWKLIAEYESGYAVLDSSYDASNPSNSHFVPWGSG